MLNLPRGWGRSQTLSELTQIKQQRLKAGKGQQANLPKEPTAPSKDQARHKG
jgi:hypothetical protein